MYINPFSAAEEVCQSDECAKGQENMMAGFFNMIGLWVLKLLEDSGRVMILFSKTLTRHSRNQTGLLFCVNQL
jgi:hypothetical protein